MLVFEVRHTYEITSGRQVEKSIGMYSSLDLAKEAISIAQTKSGFRDYKDGFFTVEHQVDPVTPNVSILKRYTFFFKAFEAAPCQKESNEGFLWSAPRLYAVCYKNYDVDADIINDTIVPFAVYTKEIFAQNAMEYIKAKIIIPSDRLAIFFEELDRFKDIGGFVVLRTSDDVERFSSGDDDSLADG